MDPGGGGRGSVPLKNRKAIESLINIGPDPLEIIERPSQHLMLDHSRPATGHHLNGVSLAGRLWPAFSGILVLSPLVR